MINHVDLDLDLDFDHDLDKPGPEVDEQPRGPELVGQL